MKSNPPKNKIINLKEAKDAQLSDELKVCHLADIHLGYRRYNRVTKNGQNQREVDISLAFREAVSKVISLKPNITIIAGDLFHHVRPTNSIITFSFREIRRLAQNTAAPVVIIAGNHEFPKRQDTGSALKILAEIDGVHISDNASEKFIFPEINTSVTCLPHSSLLEDNKAKIRADDRYKYNILALHAQIGKEQISDFGGVEVDLTSLSQFEWDYIALGHLHEMKDVALNASYSGATEHTASNIWTEARKNKGFLEVRLPSRRKIFHALTSPREVLVLSPLDAQKMDPAEVLQAIESSITQVPGGIEGKIIRLEVNNISREIQMNLNHKRIRDIRARCLNFTLELKPPLSEYSLASLSSDKPKKLNDELAEYCDALNETTIPKEQIKSLLLNYLNKVEAGNEISKFEP
jgi:exonuclease SbcD